MKILQWKKEHKYYAVFVVKNIFGTIDVIKDWGSVTSNRGNFKTVSCSTKDEILSVLKEIEQRRKYKGYNKVYDAKELINYKLLITK